MKPKAPFASRWQLRNIYILGFSLVLMAQGLYYPIYRWGFFILFAFVPIQIGLGNVNPEWGAWRTIRKTLFIILIVAVIIVFSIWLAPALVNLGRTKI
ncbi:MAG: hypothetical protein NTZ31_05985 [Actinobacteria bacterium]|jgi:hypothetical protein|nr:hypothetical protein [Actinomycetota bacterium]